MPRANGGTGASTAAQALTNLGAVAANHTHPVTDITTAAYAFRSAGFAYNNIYRALIEKHQKLVICMGLVPRTTTSGLVIAFLSTLGHSPQNCFVAGDIWRAL